MKLITTIIISLIFILPYKATAGLGEAVLIAIAAGVAEVVIVSYGISTANDNIKYLSTDRDQPSLVAGYIWGGLNMTAGLIISKQRDKDFPKLIRGSYLKIIGIGQIVIGTIDIGTTIFIHTKSEQKQLTYCPTILIDSNKKPVMGINIKLLIN